jgi:hypothetical protein
MSNSGTTTHLIQSGSMTGTSTIASQSFDVSGFKSASFEFSWTGTPTGTITIIGSISNSSFFPFTFSPNLVQPAGSAGGFLVSLDELPYPYLKVQYVNSSGSGTLDVWFFSQEYNPIT